MQLMSQQSPATIQLQLQMNQPARNLLFSCRELHHRCHLGLAHFHDSPTSVKLNQTRPVDAQEPSATNPSGFRYEEPNSAPAAVAARPPSITTPNAQSSRFIGDLNPESMFVEATGSASIRETSQKGDVGIWLSSAEGAASQGSQLVTSRPPPIMDQFLLPFVREHCLSCLPPEKDYRKLKHVFLQKIHPIFPVIPEAALTGSSESPSDIVLRQLVCLAAAPDPTMAQHLRLKNRGSDVISCQDFMQSLSSAVRAILETSVIPDRVLHVRALVMLSLYTQPSSTEEADLPAQLGGRAIHHIQTLGLHLLRYESDNGEDFETLFCAVWALDRINAASYGRPCIMHERDIGANLDRCIKRRPPCFRLLLSVCQWLDQVIELYRPGASAEASGLEKIAYIDLPVLEAMIVNADALKVPTSLIGQSHLKYTHRPANGAYSNHRNILPCCHYFIMPTSSAWHPHCSFNPSSSIS